MDFLITPEKWSVGSQSYWHERSALQAVAVRRSTGNDVSGHYFHCYFPIIFFYFFSVPPLLPFLIEGVLGSKKPTLRMLIGTANNLKLDPFPDLSAILAPTGGHFGFFTPWGFAGGERVPWRR